MHPNRTLPAALLLLALLTPASHAAPTDTDALAAYLRPTTPAPSQMRVVFTQIQRGHLVPNPAGTLTLPPKYAALTKDHRAYVTRRPGGLLLVLFPTWRGKGSNLTGFLYCSRPLLPAETHKDEYDTKYPALDLHAPGPLRPSQPSAPTEIILTHRLTPTTYAVSRDAD